MSRFPLRITAVTATAVAATLGLTVGPALAATAAPSAPAHAAAHRSTLPKDAALPANATLQQIQAAAATDITNRVTVLTTAVADVQKATDLGKDQATLLTPLQADLTALPALAQKIATDTTVSSARTDFGQIFTNYRVYALVLPVTRLVGADDRMTALAGPRLTKGAARVASKETPANQAVVAPLLSDLGAKVTAATAAVSGQTATLEGYTPAAWNGDHDLLSGARAATKAAIGDLVAARADLVKAAGDVGLTRGHHAAAGSTTTPATPATPAAPATPPSTSA